MATEMSTDHAYAADVATVFAMLTGEDYLAAKVVDLSHGPGAVVERTPQGDGWRLVTRRIVDVEVPGFAKKFLQPTNTVTQTDVWGPEVDGVREGTWSVEAKGVPVGMSGTMRLEPDGTGSLERISGTVKAGIPLVGGKLEQLIIDATSGQLVREHDYNVAWLESH